MNECNLQLEHIKLLSNLETRLESVERDTSALSEMKENLKVLTYISGKQEERLAKQQENETKQAEINEKVSMTLDTINTKIDGTNAGLKELKENFYKSEEKNKIDVRDKTKQFFGKYGSWMGFAVVLVYEGLKAFKVIG